MTIARAAMGAQFSPWKLFAGGVSGAWYDPSDISTLFQDSAGTTPVTASGDPVGKMLDKSGNGLHATQSTSGKRPIYTVSGSLAYLAFDATDDCLTVANSKGSFKFMHSTQGTLCAGARFGATSDPNTYSVLTGNNGDTDNGTVGFDVFYDDRSSNVPSCNNAVIVGVSSGGAALSGSVYLYQNNTNNSVTANADHVLYVHLDPNNATDVNRCAAYVDGSAAYTGNARTTAVSTANASYDLDIGAGGNAAARGAAMRLYGLILVATTDNAGLRAAMLRWMASKCGATL